MVRYYNKIPPGLDRIRPQRFPSSSSETSYNPKHSESSQEFDMCFFIPHTENN